MKRLTVALAMAVLVIFSVSMAPSSGSGGLPPTMSGR
jgi:hypothetical protein